MLLKEVIFFSQTTYDAGCKVRYLVVYWSQSTTLHQELEDIAVLEIMPSYSNFGCGREMQLSTSICEQLACDIF